MCKGFSYSSGFFALFCNGQQQQKGLVPPDIFVWICDSFDVNFENENAFYKIFQGELLELFLQILSKHCFH